MAFDWKKLEGDEARATDRAALVMGSIYLVILVVATAAFIAKDQLAERWPLLAFWGLVGVAMFAVGLRQRRRSRNQSQPKA